MSAWTDGYVSDIQYTAGFYREIAPGYLSVLLNIQGYRAPDANAPFTYCELGCGQGFGTSILAASYPQGRFWGVDFNPAQVANATRLAAAAGMSNIEFVEESFEGLARGARPDLPKFDYITLHGIYSWISVENRTYIVDFISRYLKPGGVVYVSYNSLPGWGAIGPLQRLLREHAMLHPDRSDRQMEGAMAFVEKMKEAGAAYFAANPVLTSRMEGMKTANRHYLAHEYLNGFWFPQYHADVAREMDRAKLTFAASAMVLENLNVFSTPEPVRKILAEITDPILYQTVKDYAINQSFRKDVYLRGATKLNRTEHDTILRAMPFTSVIRREDNSVEFKTPLGTANGSAEIYGPVMDALAGEDPVTIGQLLENPALSKQPLASLIQAYQLLLATVQAHPTFGAKDDRAAVRFNCAVADAIIGGADYGVMASPVIGTGFSISYMEACAIPLLVSDGDASLEALKDAIWKNMCRSGRRLMKEGKAIKSVDENMAGLTPIAERILKVRLPLWRKLGIV